MAWGGGAMGQERKRRPRSIQFDDSNNDVSLDDTPPHACLRSPTTLLYMHVLDTAKRRMLSDLGSATWSAEDCVG
eukprot:2652085-Rhodomonas_salina.1